MDKQARQKLKASRDAKSGVTPKNKPPVAEAKEVSDLDLIPKIIPDPMDEMGQDEITALIRESLDAAEQEIVEKKRKHTANPGRQALIEEAMSIHRQKKHIVDELPAEQREKLLFMAQQALGARLDGDK